MKKNNEEILRYLSGLMTPDETDNFLNKLKADASFKREFDKINGILSDFGTIRDSELNETYFNNLVSRVREKLPSYRRRKLLKEYAFIAPTVIVVLLVSYLTLRDIKSEIDSVDSFAGEVVKYIDNDELADNLMKDYSFESVISYQSSGNDLDIYIPENLNIPVNNISHYVDFAKLDYSQIENISGAELEKLYNNLSSLNFQKVSK